MRARGVCAAGVLLLTAAMPALADDLYPPSWRGQDGTTFAQWEFLTDDPNAPADLESNPYGDAMLTAQTGQQQYWEAQWGGRDGVWPLSGVIEVYIPNRPEPLPYKDIWVQITWAQQATGTMPLVWEKDSGITATLENEVPLENTLEPPPAGATWMHSTYSIHIEPNPDFETVRIDGAIMVDELVIDTICAPEPTALALLALGSLVVVNRRR